MGRRRYYVAIAVALVGGPIGATVALSYLALCGAGILIQNRRLRP